MNRAARRTGRAPATGRNAGIFHNSGERARSLGSEERSIAADSAANKTIAAVAVNSFNYADNNKTIAVVLAGPRCAASVKKAAAVNSRNNADNSKTIAAVSADPRCAASMKKAVAVSKWIVRDRWVAADSVVVQQCAASETRRVEVINKPIAAIPIVNKGSAPSAERRAEANSWIDHDRMIGRIRMVKMNAGNAE
jgi:hypothetical protein